MSLFRSVFNCETPDQMLQSLHSLEAVIIIIKQYFLLKIVLKTFFGGNSVKTMRGDEKNERKKY